MISEAPAWVHLSPRGEFGVVTDGRRLLQVLDDEALRRLTARFRVDLAANRGAGVLVDYDHFSLDTARSSVAAGWLKDLEIRPDGLWGKVNWTPEGAAKIAEGSFKFLSPVFTNGESLGANRVRPGRLFSVGLTNAPNMPVDPLLNRRGAADTESFTALVNRRCDETGMDLVSAARTVRALHPARHQLSVANPHQHLALLTNRVRADVGCSISDAFEWLERLLPEEFEAIGDCSQRRRTSAEKAADLMLYRALVLKNRDKLDFASAWNAVEGNPDGALLKNRMSDGDWFAERYGNLWPQMQRAEADIVANADGGNKDPRSQIYDGFLFRGGASELKQTIRRTFARAVMGYVEDEDVDISDARQRVKEENPTLYWDWIATGVEC